MFSADNKNNTVGKIKVTEVKENAEYIVTVQVDSKYLENANTTYPVTIDPTVSITYANNGAGAIEDVTINSLAGSDGTSGSL